LSHQRSLEREQTGLVRVQGQSKTPQPLREHLHHTPRILFELETDDEVIPIADEARLAGETRLYLAFKPQV